MSVNHFLKKEIIQFSRSGISNTRVLGRHISVPGKIYVKLEENVNFDNNGSCLY